jgi:hypothetical protein
MTNREHEVQIKQGKENLVLLKLAAFPCCIAMLKYITKGNDRDLKQPDVSGADEQTRHAT